MHWSRRSRQGAWKCLHSLIFSMREANCTARSLPQRSRLPYFQLFFSFCLFFPPSVQYYCCADADVVFDPTSFFDFLLTLQRPRNILETEAYAALGQSLSLGSQGVSCSGKEGSLTVDSWVMCHCLNNRTGCARCNDDTAKREFFCPQVAWSLPVEHIARKLTTTEESPVEHPRLHPWFVQFIIRS